MKKIHLLLTLGFVILAFTNCKKDDDFSIIGSWNLEKAEVAISTGVPGLPDYTLTEPDTGEVIVNFSENGTGSIIDGEETETFNWTISGNKLNFTYSDMPLELTLTTKTNSKVVGEQTLPLAQVQAILGSEMELPDLSNFPNASAKIKLTLIK